MNTTRLLLPFTHGVNMDVLEYAVLLAKDASATLVPLALIQTPEGRLTRGARLEHIQQSKDFLEVAKHIAARHSVPIERFEIFTSDIVESIALHAQKTQCESILLFMRDGNGMLLTTQEIKDLREKGLHKLCIAHLSSERSKRSTETPFRRFSNWLGRHSREGGNVVDAEARPLPAPTQESSQAESGAEDVEVLPHLLRPYSLENSSQAETVAEDVEV